MSSPEHKQKIWNYIEKIKVGMMVTEDGQDMRARPMHIVQKDYDGRLWFFTRASAEKVTETKQDRHVCISFSDPHDGVYVSMSGTARLTQNQDLIDKYWNPFVAAWFEEGRDDPEVALLEIKVHKGEHWDSKDSKVVQLYEVAKANMTEKEPDLGENEKFGS